MKPVPALRPDGEPAPRRPRLPRDAHVSFSTNPAELYVSLTMTKIEHLEALMETLRTYAPQIEAAARRREED